MYRSDEIKTVHLEVTSKCNARCPMCLHTVCGGEDNPNLPMTELSLQDMQRILPNSFVRQLDRLYMCGNYGDPIAASDTLEIFKYLRECNPQIHLMMFTNGGARPAQWWQELAKVIDACRFAIDGLEDTNHLYRQNTRWPVVMRNVKSFIEAGGKAEWDFIVFRHNEHQVENARALSEELGFKKFQAKKTGRFFSNTQSQVKEEQVVFNQSGEETHRLQMPEQEQYKNKALLKEQALIEKYGSLENYLDHTPVRCKVAEEKSVYVSAEGLVFPCCWTANQLYPWYYDKNGGPMWKLLKQRSLKEKELDGRKDGIAAVIDGPFIQEEIPGCWSKPSVKEGKLKVCAKTCGTEFDPFRSQFS